MNIWKCLNPLDGWSWVVYQLWVLWSLPTEWGKKQRPVKEKRQYRQLTTPKLMYLSTMIVLLAGMAALLAFTHLGPGDYSVYTSASGSERSGPIN